MKNPDAPIRRITIRRDANKDGTVGGSFHRGDKRFRYTAMYLHGLRTMSIVELQYENIPRKGLPFWKRMGSIHGSHMRLALVRKLNEELQPGRKLYPLTQMPPARPERIGG